MDEARTFFEERFAAHYKKTRAYRYAICLKSEGAAHWLYKRGDGRQP